MFNAVIDTNVLFTGLTRLGPDAEVVDAWIQAKFLPCVSTALALEYHAILLSKLNPRKRPHLPGALQALLSRARFTPINFTYRPASPDPGDDFVIDCTLNASACLVTNNLKDFRDSSAHLGFPLYTPLSFIQLLKQET